MTVWETTRPVGTLGANFGLGIAGAAGVATTVGEDAATLPAVEALQRRILRMAFDVHDGPMQELIAIAYSITDLRERVMGSVADKDADPLMQGFDQLRAHLVAVEQGLRSMMFSLEHNAPAEPGMHAAIDSHVTAFKWNSSALVEICIQGDIEPATESQRITIERVLAEALSNIARHADANRVRILVRGTSKSILLQVIDDGDGFDLDSLARVPGEHVGIRGMEQRLCLIDGHLKIDSRPGGPTVITATLEKWRPAPLPGPASIPR